MDQLATRERQARRFGVVERLVVLTKPGNAGGGKGPSGRRRQEATKDRGIGDEANNSMQWLRNCRRRCTQKRRTHPVSFLCLVRQGVSEGCSGICLRTLRSQRRSSGRG